MDIPANKSDSKQSNVLLGIVIESGVILAITLLAITLLGYGFEILAKREDARQHEIYNAWTHLTHRKDITFEEWKMLAGHGMLKK